MGRAAEHTWLQCNVSKKDRETIRRACELLGDDTPMHLMLIDHGKAERHEAARRACEERRRKREAKQAKETNPNV